MDLRFTQNAVLRQFKNINSDFNGFLQFTVSDWRAFLIKAKIDSYSIKTKTRKTFLHTDMAMETEPGVGIGSNRCQ